MSKRNATTPRKSTRATKAKRSAAKVQQKHKQHKQHKQRRTKRQSGTMQNPQLVAGQLPGSLDEFVVNVDDEDWLVQTVPETGEVVKAILGDVSDIHNIRPNNGFISFEHKPPRAKGFRDTKYQSSSDRFFYPLPSQESFRKAVDSLLAENNPEMVAELN